mmetsp:Transcript_15209/g.45868  ORF Transcript_15209/g.45868 Transcript_15209/m.45868 type:complete len:273 (+) Transcript_15209:1247-2065(+)
MALHLGPRPPRVAHRVLSHGGGADRGPHGHPQRRRRPALPSPRQRACPGGGILPPTGERQLRLPPVGELLPALGTPPHPRPQDVQISEELHHNQRGAGVLHAASAPADDVPAALAEHPHLQQPVPGGGGDQGEGVPQLLPQRADSSQGNQRGRGRPHLSVRHHHPLAGRGEGSGQQDRGSSSGGARQAVRQREHSGCTAAAVAADDARERVPHGAAPPPGRPRRRAATEGAAEQGGDLRDAHPVGAGAGGALVGSHHRLPGHLRRLLLRGKR